MVPGIDRLRDIHGFDGVPWWPPAPGWWLVGAGVLLILLGLWRWRTALWLRMPPLPVFRLGTWRWDAARRLRDLRHRVDTQDPKEIAGELSELVRRIAMARLGRAACAGLTGDAWLAWLRDQDPAGFDWTTDGRFLLAAPYSPPRETRLQRDALIRILEALQTWITVEDPKGV